MSQNCDCNDYARLTAKIGIGQLTTSDVSLKPTAPTSILTGGANGTKVRSVIIKATQSTTQGMVRLFVSNAAGKFYLIKEFSIPPMPSLMSTPTPPLVLPMYVAYYVGDIFLGPADVLAATTQNTELFNVIAEAVDISYVPNPTVCCNFMQNYPVTGMDFVDTANAALDGTGAIVDIITAASGAHDFGTLIKSITIKALQNTSPGMARLFIKDGGANYYLYNEIMIPQTNQSAITPSFSITLPQDFCLENGFSIAASTQISQSFAVTIKAEKWVYP